MKLYTFDSKTLKYKSFNVRGGLVKIVSLLFITFLVLGVSPAPVRTEYITAEKLLLIELEEENKFSEENLIEEISKLNFKYPHIVLAQAILETGTYESKIFRENNNLFGMKEARVRLNLAKGTQFGHAYYDSWKESVTDYALWYSTFAYRCKSEKQLYKLLDKQYAEADAYVSSLQHVIKINNLKEKFE